MIRMRNVECGMRNKFFIDLPPLRQLEEGKNGVRELKVENKEAIA